MFLIPALKLFHKHLRLFCNTYFTEHTRQEAWAPVSPDRDLFLGGRGSSGPGRLLPRKAGLHTTCHRGHDRPHPGHLSASDTAVPTLCSSLSLPEGNCPGCGKSKSNQLQGCLTGLLRADTREQEGQVKSRSSKVQGHLKATDCLTGVTTRNMPYAGQTLPQE